MQWVAVGCSESLWIPVGSSRSRWRRLTRCLICAGGRLFQPRKPVGLCHTLQRDHDQNTNCITLHLTAGHCNTLPHATTHCNTLHRIATHSNTLYLTTGHCCSVLQCVAVYCSVLQCVALCSETVRHAVRHEYNTCCFTLQHTVSHCITLQHTATHCNTLRILCRYQ